MTTSLYQSYAQKMQKIADIGSSIAVLSWDQETYLPEKGADHRASQIATLSGIAHELSTADDLGDMLQQLYAQRADLSQIDRRNVDESWKNYQRSKKFSSEFVMEMSRTVSEAFQHWVKARSANQFDIFKPFLAKLIDLKRQEAAILGYEHHPYDALLDQYEPGERTANIDTLFADVKSQLVDFVHEIALRPKPDNAFMYGHFDKDTQWQFGIELLKQMGYDFASGRQDVSAHPFTISFTPNDVRVTTRIDENDLYTMIWSCIHEGGHALYEQGLPGDQYGLPVGSALSLGFHESQSRLWENNVGRSLPYWTYHFPHLQRLFPTQLGGVTVHDFYRAINIVQPSFIRTNADELTYHFHILIRFELEKALIEGSLDVDDLREAWNSKYKAYLGLDVPDDRQGVLQDVHWSHGSFGYFPTYSLGSFYAAQFYARAVADIPQLEAQIAQGNCQLLLDWLRKHIHEKGNLYTAEELCTAITGENLNFSYFMQYAKQKYGKMYGL